MIINRYDRLAISAEGKSRETGYVRAFAAFRTENRSELARLLKVDKATVSRWSATEYMRLYIRGGVALLRPEEKHRQTRLLRRMRRELSPAHFSALTTLARQYEFSPLVALGFLVDAAEAGMSVRAFAYEVKACLNGDPGDIWHDYRKYSALLRELSDKIIVCPDEFREAAFVVADQLRDLSNKVKGRIE